MKKYLIAGLLILGFVLTGAARVHAQSNEALIQSLIQQIAALQAQLSALLAGQSGGDFTRDLSYGMENDNDVRRLQTLLLQWGFYNGPITGGFFNLTRAAVARFQIAENVPGTGYFGPLSRAAANRRLATQEKAPIIDAISGPSAVRTNSSASWTMSARDPEGKMLSYSAKWNDGTADLPFSSSNTITHIYKQGGTYRIDVIVRDEGGKTTTGSKTIEVGTSQGLSVKTNSSLSATVDKSYSAIFTLSGSTSSPFIWGLESAPPGLSFSATSSSANEKILSGTPTTAGTYHTKITVEDRFGNKDSDTFTIIVAPVAQVTVQSPNGGEIWLRTSPQVIRWTISPSTKVDVYLRNVDTNASILVKQDDQDTSHSWMPSDVATGKYRVRIFQSDTSTQMDESDNVFDIISSTSTVALSDMSPRLGSANTRITLTGERFNATSTVRFGGVLGTNVTRSGRTISFNIPSSIATSGTYAVFVETDNGDSNSLNFQYTALQSITITNPNQSATWTRGSNRTIAWTGDMGDRFHVVLVGSGSLGSYTVVSGTQAKSVSWNVANSIPVGTYTLRVVNADNANEYDDANGTITIQ